MSFDKKINFYDFFMNKPSITEFYLYSTYLIFSGNINKHELVSLEPSVTIFWDPTASWNMYEGKKYVITDKSVKIFGLHRHAVKTMDNNYKKNLLTLYSNFFDEVTCSMIKSLMKI